MDWSRDSFYGFTNRRAMTGGPPWKRLKEHGIGPCKTVEKFWKAAGATGPAGGARLHKNQCITLYSKQLNGKFLMWKTGTLFG